MRIGLTTWNIGFYECKKNKQDVVKWVIPYNANRETDKLVEILLSHSSDIIVLNEFGKKSNRPNNPIDGTEIIKKLEENGYECIYTNNYYRSILIAINTEIGMKFGENDANVKRARASSLYSTIVLPSKCKKIKSLNILGVGVPALGKYTTRKDIEDFWKERIFKNIKGHLQQEQVATIIAGDFNAFSSEDSVLQKPSEFSIYLNELNGLLFDSWKVKHLNLYKEKNAIKDEAWTWYSSSGNGRRLDYIFVSNNIIDTLYAEHFHQERTEGYSDHSAVHITFEV